MELTDIAVRDARPEDHDAVAAFTRDTWPERGGDYLPDVYPEWIEDEEARTLVAEVDGEVAGIAQCVLLSPYEAWCQGLRVAPEFRERGVSERLTYELFDWARERGAVVARNMVFSWNAAGLGQSRAVGFDPATVFRWAHPEPDPGAAADRDVTDDPDIAWHAWTESDAHASLRGLALDFEETWALSRLTRADLHRAADETAVFAVGSAGAAFRVRDYDREFERDGETRRERRAEYGVACWEDLAAGRAVFAAIAWDAAAIGADVARVLIPETPRHVSDAAYLRADLADEPDFVLAADLTRR